MKVMSIRVLEYVWQKKHGVGYVVERNIKRMQASVFFLKKEKEILVNTESLYGIGNYKDTEENKRLALKKGKQFEKYIGDYDE